MRTSLSRVGQIGQIGRTGRTGRDRRRCPGAGLPRLRGALAGSVACLALACAAGSGGGKEGSGKVADTSQFPSAEQLEKLATTPAPATLKIFDVRPVDSWELAGPFPERIAVESWVDPQSPWSALLDEAARRRVGLVVPTEAMHCVARELGRFMLANRGQPTPSLRQFITSRCNASVGGTSFRTIDGEVPPDLSEAELFTHWKGPVDEAIRKGLRGGPQTAGIWFGREGTRALVMIVLGERQIHLEPLSPFATGDGAIELRGESLGTAESISGLVNHGRLAVRECEPVGDAKPPSFHLRCPLDPEDEQALVAVSVHPPGRLLGDLGVVVLAWPRGRATSVYRRPVYAESWPMLDAQDFGSGFAELLNRVRKEAGLRPLTLDPGQSETATELAPHFFAALYGQTDEFTADLIALGMLAGWTVDGIVQMGHFASAWSMRSTDLADLLASALEFPVGRATLLADEVERIAIGPMLSTAKGEESMAALFGTYSLFSEANHEAMARRVYERLEAERRRRGMPPPERIPDVAGLCQWSASSVQAGVEPADALDSLLRKSVDVLQRPVAGWIAEVSEIETLEFPEEHLLRPDLGVAIAVSHRREKGDAWGRYVVMLVIADPESHGV